VGMDGDKITSPNGAARCRHMTKKQTFQKLVVSGITCLFVLLLSWVSQSIAPSPLPDSAHPIELYSNQTQNDLQQTFAVAIGEAKKSVLLIIYSLTDNTIIESLKNKSIQGVEVTVICDPKASRRVERRLGPQVNTVKRFAEGLMHQKILVIDETLVWIGSANMTTESLRNHGNLVVGFESPSLAAAIKSKAHGMEADDDSIVLHQETVLGGQQVELWFLPDDTQAVNRIKQLLRAAQKSIKVAMFTWTRYDLAQEVLNAAKRGVRVEAVIDRQSGYGASAKVVEILQKGGLPVRLSTGSALLHHKFAIIDDTILINGSANWTKAAFTQNDDCFIILHGITDEQKSLLDDLWSVVAHESR